MPFGMVLFCFNIALFWFVVDDVLLIGFWMRVICALKNPIKMFLLPSYCFRLADMETVARSITCAAVIV